MMTASRTGLAGCSDSSPLKSQAWASDRGAYRAKGFTDAAEWFARAVGSSPSEAKAAMDTAREIAGDAFIKAVLHDGVDILKVKHFGRHIRAELRTALELGPAPEFHGTACRAPGCGRRYNLEWDHVDPVANGGATSFHNLQPRCWPHHRDKTERDRRAGLLRPKETAERGPP